MTPSGETSDCHLRKTGSEGQSRRILLRICSRRFRLMPRMISSSSIRRKGGFLLRYATIRCAVASPIPGRVFNSVTEARLILICGRPSAPDLVPLWDFGASEFFPLPYKKRMSIDVANRRQIRMVVKQIRASGSDGHPLRCLSEYTGLSPFVSTLSPESSGECREIPSSQHEIPDRRTRELKSKLKRTKTVVWAW